MAPYHTDAHAWLFSRINYERTSPASGGRSFKLARVKRLLSRLGNPHHALPVVHIAGSKGKGSTAAMIAHSLTLAGKRTGLFTSPHLEQIEERICIDGQICPSERFAELIAIVRQAAQSMDQNETDGRVTFFEIVTAAAFLQYAAEQVDIAVMEVGLGGRLDSTNVCRPAVSVITNISLDHTQILGSTLESIAQEKAGIIKPSVPVVSGETTPCSRAVIARTSQDRGAPLLQRGVDFDIARQPHSPASDARWDYWEQASGNSLSINELTIGMTGRHQADNAALALAALATLRRQGWPLTEHCLREGVATAVAAARVEVVARRPTVVVDTAHNVASVEALCRTLNEQFSHKRRLLVLAISSDKDVAAMLRTMLPHFDEVVFTRYVTNPRAVAPQTLLQAALAEQQAWQDDRQLKLSVEDHPVAALEKIWRRANPDDLVCVTGSFFIAAELRGVAMDMRTAERAAPFGDP